MKRIKETWNNIPNGWEALSEEWLKKLSELYKNRNWKPGKTINIGPRVCKVYPELSTAIGITYDWKTGKCNQVKWSTEK